MKSILFTLCLLPLIVLSQKMDKEFVLFLNQQQTSAKDYVINQFKKYDIVILCERNHKEFTQYELVKEIIEDPYFIKNVGHIFTELGCVNMDARLNKFLQSKNTTSIDSDNRLLAVYRDIFDQPYWEPHSYPWLINTVFNMNQRLQPALKLQMHPIDQSFDWAQIKSAADYRRYYTNRSHRDSLMGINVAEKFDKLKLKKALVIMNYKHAFLKSHTFLNERLHNTGEYLYNRYKNRVAGIYLMGLAIPQINNYTIVQNGKWDFYFESLNKKSVGFDLNNTPFGKAAFDVIPPDNNGKYEYKYEEMFTGLLYYKPLKEQCLKTGWKGFASNDFLPELRRRIEIFSEAMDMNLSSEQKERLMYEHNKIVCSKYPNLNSFMEMINQWK